MSKIDEWTKIVPKMGETSTESAGEAIAPAGKAQELANEIYDKLIAMPPALPIAVHFYLGEGLRWIRVGMGGSEPIEPSMVASIGRVIRSSCNSEKLFFHALRPHDMLFFLEGGNIEDQGMSAEYFGADLEVVLKTWGFGPEVVHGRKSPSRERRA